MVSGDLPQAEQAEVRQHLTDCRDCQKRLEQLQSIVKVLDGASVDWLDESAEAVLNRVSANFRSGALVAGGVRASQAGVDSEEFATRAATARRPSRRFVAWLAGGSLVAGMTGIAIFGWLADWWQAEPARPGGSKLVRDQQITGEPTLEEIASETSAEFPTWWELQRSLRESDAAFDRALARGHLGGGEPSLDLGRLLKELSQ